MKEHKASTVLDERQSIEAAIEQVTLLEDRAQVRRRTKIELGAGRQLLSLSPISPLAYSLSIRAEQLSGPGRVSDLRLRRALRIRSYERPEAVEALEEEIRRLSVEDNNKARGIQRAEERLNLIREMLHQSAQELPEEIAWGLHDVERWRQEFSALSARSQALREQRLELHFRREELQIELADHLQRRGLADRPDLKIIASIELDLLMEEAGELELQIEYVVPNALWRPIHQARLKGEQLQLTAQAAIWQNTGEDWENVRLFFSTARCSLGNEPPLLSPDLLEAQRKRDLLIIEAREVEIQRASQPRMSAVDLPGVDDGGEIRLLEAEGHHSIPSNGRPAFLPLFRFEAPAQISKILLGEWSPQVLLKLKSQNLGPAPLLAGPVELIRESGAVGWSRLLFVPQGGAITLGFGPLESLRVVREQKVERETNPITGWTDQDTEVMLYFSNLSAEPHEVEVIERIPVSELEQVRVELIHAETSGAPKVDVDGFCRERWELPPHSQQVIRFKWRLSSAAEVQRG